MVKIIKNAVPALNAVVDNASVKYKIAPCWNNIAEIKNINTFSISL